MINFLLDGQTEQEKLPSQLINFSRCPAPNETPGTAIHVGTNPCPAVKLIKAQSLDNEI